MKRISAPHLASMLDFGYYQGIHTPFIQDLLSQVDIDLCNPTHYVREETYLKVLNEFVTESKDDYLGLHYGGFLNLKALGLILEISLNASSVEQAVFILQEYLASSFPLVELIIKKNQKTCSLELISAIENEALKRNVLDAVLAIVYRELCLMLPVGKRPILQVRDKSIEIYAKFLGAVVEQGDINRIILSNEVLGQEINTKRIKEIEYLLPQFLMMLTNREEDKTFSGQIRDMILNMCRPELPNFEQVAKQFPLSKRTIQRKLTIEGSSFRKITNAIKKELSTYLIKGKFMKTKDISLILGYSEPSAYLHAVSKWNALDGRNNC